MCKVNYVKFRTDKRIFIHIRYSFKRVSPECYETSKDGWEATVYEVSADNNCIGKLRIYPNSEIEVYLFDYVDRNITGSIIRGFISQIWRGNIQVPEKACFTREEALALKMQQEMEEKENKKLAA